MKKRPLYDLKHLFFTTNANHKRLKIDLIRLYCSVDDFWKFFKQEWDKYLIANGKTKKGSEPELSIPEIMTIMILFH